VAIPFSPQAAHRSTLHLAAEKIDFLGGQIKQSEDAVVQFGFGNDAADFCVQLSVAESLGRI
jgi:hypothetical protein